MKIYRKRERQRYSGTAGPEQEHVAGVVPGYGLSFRHVGNDGRLLPGCLFNMVARIYRVD
jgi:hypothetical protein